MKKILLTCAASMLLASTGASAQTMIAGKPLKDYFSVYGDIDAGVGRFNTPGGKAENRVESGLFSPSYVGFSGRMPIQEGLRGIFALETYVDIDKGTGFSRYYPDDPFWGRASYIGLESDAYGTVTLGRNKNPFYYAATENNAFGESFFSPALNVAAFRRGHVIGRSHDNSVRYSSPTIAGFSASALWAPKEEKTNGDDMSATIKYATGPWVAVFGAAQAKSGLSEGAKSSIQLFATNYDFRVVKLFAEYATQRDTEVDVKSKAWDIGLVAPFGKYSVRTSVARIRQTDLGGNNGLTYRVASIGADYTFAEGWSVYAGYKNDKVTGISSASSFGTGVRWQF